MPPSEDFLTSSRTPLSSPCPSFHQRIPVGWSWSEPCGVLPHPASPASGSALRPASARAHRLRTNLRHCCHRIRGGRSSDSCSHAGKTGAVSRPRPLGPRSDIASRSLPCGWDACAQRAGPDGLEIVAACAAALPEGAPDLPDRGIPRGWVALSFTIARRRRLRTGTPTLHRHLIVRRKTCERSRRSA